MSDVLNQIQFLHGFYLAAVRIILEDFEDFACKLKRIRRSLTGEKSPGLQYENFNIQHLQKIKEVFFNCNSELASKLSLHVDRRFWVKPRHSKYWEEDVQYYTDSDWIQNFRMRRSDFCELVTLLQNEISHSVTFVRDPVPVDKRAAIALYKLASCAEYRTVANLFAVGKSTVQKFLAIFCDAVMKILFHSLVRMPDSNEAFQLSFRFLLKYNIPMCIGFIDGTHIPILAPEEGRKDFINRKMYPSLVLQAVVDADCKFRNISCKMPGSAHDATVLKSSNIFLNPDKFIPTGSQNVDGKDIPFYIYGDPAYPILPWLLKGYSHSANMCPLQESYNAYMSSIRIHVEMAFGRLKGRWRILLKRMDLNYKTVPKVVAVCCALNNFCEKRNVPLPMDTEDVLRSAEETYPQPHQRLYNNENESAHSIRNHICKYMADKNPLRKSFR